jgi:SAM-dependent methyltransferase
LAARLVMPVRDGLTRGLRRLRSGIALLRWRDFAMSIRRCPFCGVSIFVRLRRDEIGVRCVRCGASVVHLSIGYALRRVVGDLANRQVCELSARGPLVAFLRRRARSVALSEYFADVAPGGIRDGVRCEDVQRLTYADASFDVVTHTEVLEHVPDDARGFAELRRVLRPGGVMLFTVPMHGGEHTVERATLRGNDLVHLLPPVYHTDPLRGHSGILAFRDYGKDILDRLGAAGFTEVALEPAPVMLWGYARAVIIARRAA